MYDTCEVPEQKDKVLVYGSLKAGFGNHPVITRAGGKLLGVVKTLPRYTMISMGYFPGVLNGGDTAITGEIYEVDSLRGLDALEGHPSFYKRELVATDNGDTVWMYILNRDYTIRHNGQEVESGEWTIAHQRGIA